jgi:hypothetical protein
MQALTKATVSRSSLQSLCEVISAFRLRLSCSQILAAWNRGGCPGLLEKGDFSQSPSDFVDVLATTAKTPRAMDKWVLRLDLTGQKGLDNTLKSLLVVSDSCCTIE